MEINKDVFIQFIQKHKKYQGIIHNYFTQPFNPEHIGRVFIKYNDFGYYEIVIFGEHRQKLLKLVMYPDEFNQLTYEDEFVKLVNDEC